jgi:nitrite reductase/ring-hydroxylating ferredoxin subunit
VIKLIQWIKACNLDQVKIGHLFGFSYGDKKILLVNQKGKFYATDLICTHAEADLSTGFLSEDGVRCPLHLSVFNLRTGKPENLPAEIPLKTYNVKIEQNEIYVEV